MSVHAPFTLIYDREAPYPRIHAGTGKLAEPIIKPVAPVHIEGGTLSPCCIAAGNLERKEGPRPDILMTVCRRCGRRHFRGIAESGKLIVRG